MNLHPAVLALFGGFIALWFTAGPLREVTSQHPDATTAAVVATSVNVTIPGTRAQNARSRELTRGNGLLPKEAVAACRSKDLNESCAFTSPRGDTVHGVCGAPPGSTSLACMPR